MTTKQQSFTLSDVIQHKNTLTDEQKEAFIEIFSKGCRVKKKADLRKAINDVGIYDVGYFENFSIYSGVIFYLEPPHCKYLALQEYPKEVRAVREVFTKGY